MDTVILLLAVAIAWRVLCSRYQRTHIALLGKHLRQFQLERHMETLTQSYTRAIQEKEESRLLQVLATLSQTESAVASQALALASSMDKENREACSILALPFYIPYAEKILPGFTRDFRVLLHIHATGLRYVVNNEAGWDPKTRAFHLSAELYLLQHSCHWFCKSRTVADARLQLRHKVQHQKVLESVSTVTRQAYTNWLQDTTQPKH